MPEGAVCILMIWAMFPTIIIVALVVKLREVRIARRWPSAEGRVIASAVQPRRNQPGDAGYNFSDTEVENEPRVEYEFKVGNQKYVGRRITIGDKTSSYELEEILARYPVGATVTVYYDPANPETAVLERDLPAGIMFKGVGCLLLLFIGGPLLAIILYFVGVAWLKSHLANPGLAPFVAAATGFGLLCLFFAIALMGMVLKAKRWPVARGRVLSSGVEAHYVSDEGSTRKHYKSSVVYSYEVNGRKYNGDRLTLAATGSATFPGMAKRTARKYPVGSEVDVHYNPLKPSESVLHPYSHVHWLPLLMAAVMFALAWAVATGRM